MSDSINFTKHLQSWLRLLSKCVPTCYWLMTNHVLFWQNVHVWTHHKCRLSLPYSFVHHTSMSDNSKTKVGGGEPISTSPKWVKVLIRVLRFQGWSFLFVYLSYFVCYSCLRKLISQPANIYNHFVKVQESWYFVLYCT